ncbi:MAG TPA: hypothetical protein PKA63_09600 [Oligoflexia bacterium]|nr:hypothetical protein [Oligoflexia bacterium]HMP48908.1 hypothetical protein [Oligoflexia bacterium]
MGHNQLEGVLDEVDPCSSFGPDQRWSFVWLLGVLVFASLLTIFLARIDSWMYHNDDLVEVAGVRLIDNDKYRENRRASFGIASERSDPRSRGSYSKAVSSHK